MYHTDIVTSDWMRCVVVIKGKVIHSLKQGATCYVLEFYVLLLCYKIIMCRLDVSNIVIVSIIQVSQKGDHVNITCMHNYVTQITE